MEYFIDSVHSLFVLANKDSHDWHGISIRGFLKWYALYKSTFYLLTYFTWLVPDVMVDMVNANYAHIRWLDVLCPMLVMFGAHSRSFYEWRIASLWPRDSLMCFVCLLAKQHVTFTWNGVIFMFLVLQCSTETLLRRGGQLYHLSVAYFLGKIHAKLLLLESLDEYPSYS